ncbi:MAG: RNA polymerase subunit sigma-24 [Planctomycetes bacterium]|nr:RNA polymerase subunit sigma-24 [Planctomycetota bacterium]
MRDADKETIRRCQEGDVSVLSQLLDVYGERIYAICRRMVGNDADAEDLMQQVLLRVLDQAHTFDGRSRFWTWLSRVTANHALNFLKAARRRRTEVLEDDAGAAPDPTRDPFEASARREDGAVLDRLLGRLAARHRAVLVLRELGELTYSEIAEALEIPVGTVMSRLARARTRLRDLLESENLVGPME